MLVAILLSVIGFLAVAVLTQLYGYRLGGTISIPVLSVYTLKNFVMLPTYVLSTLVATIGLAVLREKTLVYGRDELIAAILLGSAIPIGVLLAFGVVFDNALRDVVFIGSILPGLAAYNYHQLEREKRLADTLVAGGLLLVLLALGWMLVAPRFQTSLLTDTPIVLYSTTADIAHLRNVAIDTQLSPVILPRPLTVGLFAAGMLISESVRSRYAVRTGIVTVALLAIFALASRWLLVAYISILAACYGFIQGTHYGTYLYGRVLLGISCAVGVLATWAFPSLLPITRGLSLYFVGILAGVNAYNIHATAPGRRHLFVPLQLGAFSLLLLAARSTGVVLRNGIPRFLGLSEAVTLVVVALLSFAYVEWRCVPSPSREDVYDASLFARLNRRDTTEQPDE